MKIKHLFIAITTLITIAPCVQAASANNHSAYPSFYYYDISNSLSSLAVRVDESRNGGSGPSNTLSPEETQRYGGYFNTITDNVSLAGTGEKICEINVTQYGITSIQNFSTQYSCQSDGKSEEPTINIVTKE